MADQNKFSVHYKAQGEVLAAYGASDTFVQIIRGPLAGGKTKATIFKCLRKICEQRPDRQGVRKSRVAVVRNTYPDLLTTTIRDWLEVVPQTLGIFSKGHPPEHKLDFDLPDGTRVVAEVLFLALDRPDDVKKLRGTAFTFAWLNEGKEIPYAILEMMTGRVDRYPMPQFSTWVGILSDTNAWDQDHWMHKMLFEPWQRGELSNYEFFVQPGAVMKEGTKWVVNPAAENLDVVGFKYYERQIEGKREDWIKVNLANEIGLCFDGKPVHPTYSDSIHTASELLSPVPGIVYCGFDHGLTPAMVMSQRKANGQWQTFDELVGENIGAERFAVEIKAKLAKWGNLVPGLTYVLKGDPSGDERAQTDENTVFRIYRTNGVMMMAASSNDVSVRRGALERPLTRMLDGGKPGILISPNCIKLRKGLAGAFCYKRIQVSGEEKYRDVPDKTEYSHVVEAQEYGLMDAGESVKVGGEGVYGQPRVARPVPVSPQKFGWSPHDI